MKFGWCMTKQHEKCPVIVKRIVVDDKGVHTTGTTSECGCECHETES